MKPLLTTLKKAPYLVLTVILTLALFALYTFFDLRQGGTHLTVFSTHVMLLQFFVQRFGLVYVVSRMVLDLMSALLSAMLIAVTIDNSRNGSGLFAGSACSTGATIILGFTTFGCPTCVLPIVGTFGAIFTVQALPLFGFEFKILALVMTLGTLIWLLGRLKQAPQAAIELQK